MCGFAGFYDPAGLSDNDTQDILSKMGDSLAHRGPDGSGKWCDLAAGVALTHRRLAILDLSVAGHQPMASSSGRFVLTFNGEIYNHLELRSQLEGVLGSIDWKGHSDTETLLVAIELWGLELTLNRLIGMFAFALWDAESCSLYLARDRMGEKPLYYGWQEGIFIFGSELKSIKRHPKFRGEINRNAIKLLLRHNYIPAPHSIYMGIYKLEPGSFMHIRGGTCAQNSIPQQYWSLKDVVTRSASSKFSGKDVDAIKFLDIVMRESVQQQMLSDVPLGAFLSGGVDSSIIVAMMQTFSPRPISTFTIGFDESKFNEAVHAQAVAKHLGTNHNELYVSLEGVRSVIPKLPLIYDEPFADSSQIPTFLVSELAKQHVKVALSGDGADELFAGYTRYVKSHRIWNYLSALPSPVCKGLSKALMLPSIKGWDYLAAPIKPFLSQGVKNIGDKAYKFSELIAERDRMKFYHRFLSYWAHPECAVLSEIGVENSFEMPPQDGEGVHYIESMMLTDSLSYLPDDILVKVDRAAMAVSLETRAPFLNHKLVEFVWGLPLGLKIRNGQGKWLLKQLLYEYVPRELIERPKMGFGVPVASWLRGPLRSWAEELLDEGRLKREGFFNPQVIREKWNEHISGKRNWHHHLWGVLMFQAWLEHEAMSP